MTASNFLGIKSLYKLFVWSWFHFGQWYLQRSLLLRAIYLFPETQTWNNYTEAILFAVMFDQ